MARAQIPFGELLPDQPAYGNAGLLVAGGVYPIANGYKPVGDFSASINGTLPADCLGVAAFRSKAGTVFTVAGTTTNLYRYTPSAGWVSVGSGYSASTSIGWRFRQWGDLIIATNGANSPQKLDMSAGSPSFSALGGTPPTGDGIIIVRDFVVLLRAGADAMKLRWSAINNAEAWTIGTSQADEQVMPTGGELTGWAGGEDMLILQERRAVRGSYVGGDAIFQFDEISASIGCMAAGSVVSVGRMVYFLSQQGFAVSDRNSVQIIGDEKVNRTVLAEIDRSYLPQMSVTVDPRNSLIIWAIPNAAEPTKLYIYNYALNRWSTATQTVQRLFQGLTESVTLEDLDATYASIDSMAASLDDAQWKGGYPIVALIDGDRKLGTLSGQPKAATFTTGDLALAAPMQTLLGDVVPLVDAASGLTLTVSYRDTLGGSAQTQEYTALNRAGAFPARASGRFVRLSLAVAAGTSWTSAVGLEAEFDAGGM